MRRPHRIAEMVAGLALKGREAVADLDQPECQGLRDRRMRQAALDDRLQDLFAGQSRDLLGISHTVPMSRESIHGRYSHADTNVVYAYNYV